MKSSLLIGLSAAVLLSGCASPTVVQSVKPGDVGLTCAQLQNEYSEAEKMRKDADAEKGVTGGNAARLLFWPLIIGTYMNANEAIAAAETRKVHVTNQLIQKKCQVPNGMQISDSQYLEKATAESISTTQSKEAKLLELKRLFESGLLTNDVYRDRQKAILGGS